MSGPEEWRPVAGFEVYEVSNLGNVRSVDRWRRNRQSLYLVRGRPVTQHALQSSHLCVYLYNEAGRKENKHKRHLVHRLVLTAFRGPCPEGHEGCHIDGVPANNLLENLYWGTHSQNMLDSVRHGTHNSRQKAQRTHCRNRHEWTLENCYYLPGGGRRCRQCLRDGERRRYHQRKRKAAA
jgi:hypothetical protein